MNIFTANVPKIEQPPFAVNLGLCFIHRNHIFYHSDAEAITIRGNNVNGIATYVLDSMVLIIQGLCAIWDIRSKRILNSNLAKSCLHITYFAVAKSF